MGSATARVTADSFSSLSHENSGDSAQAIASIEAACALSPGGVGPDYWCLSASNELVILFGGAALAFFVKVENVHISIDVIGDISLDSLMGRDDNKGLRHIAILTQTYPSSGHHERLVPT